MTVAGVSMLRLVDWAGTPCVHNCDGPASVVVARVTSVAVSATGAVEVTIDADLDGCKPVVEATRMIGREPRCARFDMLVRSPKDDALNYVVRALPADIAAGDLLAFPCVGPSALHDVRVA